ncbi:MAG: 4Fe-4S binding protein [Mycobacteriales bacterium]
MNEHRSLPARSRGVIALLEEACTVCMICARECPDWCISIEGHQETPVQEGQRRPRVHNVLDRFMIDYGLCMYCGICVEVCPFDALVWAPEFSYPAADRSGLRHERTELSAWRASASPSEVSADEPVPSGELAHRASDS